MTSAEEPPASNEVFESSVVDFNDQAGLMAYALYERDKRDFLADWQARYGRPASSEQLAAFAAAVLTEGQRQRYRMDGEANLEAYANKALERERPLITEAAVTGRIEIAARRIENASRWGRQIPAGIAAALIYTLLLIAILLVLRYAGVDLESILDQVGAPARPSG